jgi:hypothetical protein
VRSHPDIGNCKHSSVQYCSILYEVRSRHSGPIDYRYPLIAETRHVMLAHTHALVIGLTAGLLLAVLLQQLVVHPGVKVASGPAPLYAPNAMASALRNSLQIAQQALRRSGYKSTRVALNSPPLTSQTSTSHSTRTVTLPPSTLSKPFSTASPAMSSSKSFIDAVKDRRSIYQLNKEAPISDKAIVDIVNTLVKHVPSSFNSQSTRLVVLLNKDHDKFWDFAAETLKPMVPEQQWPTTEKKLGGFQGAYGTVSLANLPPFLPRTTCGSVRRAQ